ncbi:MAG: STAS domain-containing protein [SAR324 cluster bacterium]|nr:STAS domain-containing protein [SAR324 cluster bacterium]
MKFAHRIENGIYVIYPEGNLMTGSVEKLYAYIGNSLGNEVIKGFLVNLKDVIYIDSTGLGAIVFLYKKYLKHQIRVFLCNADENIWQIFNVSELDKIISLYDTEQQALTAFVSTD